MYIIMSNPWITHLKKVRQENPSLSYKECMVKGKKSYTKKQTGGSVSAYKNLPKSLYNSNMKPMTKAQVAQLGLRVGGSVYVPGDLKNMKYKQFTKPLTKAQLAQFGLGVGDQAGRIWNLLKKVGKATAVASLAIPAGVLASQALFIAYLKSQPDNGAAFIQKSGKWLSEHGKEFID